MFLPPGFAGSAGHEDVGNFAGRSYPDAPLLRIPSPACRRYFFLRFLRRHPTLSACRQYQGIRKAMFRHSTERGSFFMEEEKDKSTGECSPQSVTNCPPWFCLPASPVRQVMRMSGILQGGVTKTPLSREYRLPPADGTFSSCFEAASNTLCLPTVPRDTESHVPSSCETWFFLWRRKRDELFMRKNL